jgi:hypothetical protein
MATVSKELRRQAWLAFASAAIAAGDTVDDAHDVAYDMLGHYLAGEASGFELEGEEEDEDSEEEEDRPAPRRRSRRK